MTDLLAKAQERMNPMPRFRMCYAFTLCGTTYGGMEDVTADTIDEAMAKLRDNHSSAPNLEVRTIRDEQGERIHFREDESK